MTQISPEAREAAREALAQVNGGEPPLDRRGDGTPYRTVRNVRLYVPAKFAGRVHYDPFREELLLDGSPEHVVERVLEALAQDFPSVAWSHDLVQRGLELAIAVKAIPHRDSLLMAVSACGWDGVPRFEQAVREGLELEEDYAPELAVDALRTLFLALVGRAVEPGCKADHVVVLVGRQGIGKSGWVRMLALDESWYTDSLDLGRLGERDSLVALEGRHVVELAELAGMDRARLESVKAWITRQEDVYRPAYAYEARRRRRRFVLVGTTNDEAFLADSENRRWVPLRVRAIHHRWWREHLRLLYGEALAAWNAGDRPVLARHELLAEEHERAQRGDPWEIVVLEMSRECREFTAQAVLQRLGRRLDQATRADYTRIGAIVARVLPEWRKVRVRRGDSRGWAWRAPD